MMVVAFEPMLSVSLIGRRFSSFMWKLSSRKCTVPLLLLFSIVILTLMYTNVQVRPGFPTTVPNIGQLNAADSRAYQTEISNHPDNSDTLNCSRDDSFSVNETKATRNKSTALQYVHNASPRQPIILYPIPNFKSEQWYLSAIKKLSYKIVTPSSLLLEQPYFQPNPETRFEIADWELISPVKCTERTNMVILILSEPNSFGRRKVIRQTWGSVASRRGKKWPWVAFDMDIRLLFVVGVRDEVMAMEAGTPKESVNEYRLKKESTAHDDILQLSTVDSYSNLTRKVISAFKWINKSCQGVQYVLKADQDIFVNVPLVSQFLTHHGRSNSIYGFIYFHGEVRRIGKWALSKSSVPIDLFPAYAAGTSYVMSSDAIAKVLRSYYLFPYVRIEDAFITGILAVVAKIDRYHVQGFTHWSEGSSDPCQVVMDRVYAINRVNYTSLREIWSEVQGRGHGRCA